MEPEMTDHIRYDILARDAMRGVLRQVLTDVAKNGLPGDHHFSITFMTRHEGVQLSPRLMAQYPEEMTVILQHQFWDMIVTPEQFEVGLSFGGIPERVVVPFSAIRSFLDPSVQFGLQFDTMDIAPAEAEEPAPPVALSPPPVKAGEPEDAGEAGDKKPADGGGAEVVRLDRFRKK
jgi:uncharacterized protein